MYLSCSSDLVIKFAGYKYMRACGHSVFTASASEAFEGRQGMEWYDVSSGSLTGRMWIVGRTMAWKANIGYRRAQDSTIVTLGWVQSDGGLPRWPLMGEGVDADM